MVREKPDRESSSALCQSIYAVSDTVWFKAYISSGPHRHLSGLSRLLYAELIGPDNKLIKGLTLPAASGDLALADPLAPGQYRIRAYTNWMRNAGAAYFFDRPLEIGGYTENDKKTPKKARLRPLAETTDVQFFPEGGTLLHGVQSKIAFKAVSENGLGAEIAGTVLDGGNQRISDIKTQHAGMGEFSIVALKDVRYQAKVRFADGSEKMVQLPDAKERGYSLSVSDSDSLLVKVSVDSITFRESQGRNISVVGHSGGTIFYGSGGSLSSAEFTAFISEISLWRDTGKSV